MVLSPDFYDKLSADDKKAWEDEYKEDVMAYFNRSLVTKIGNATLKMLRFVFSRGDSPIKMTGVLVGNFEKNP